VRRPKLYFVIDALSLRTLRCPRSSIYALIPTETADDLALPPFFACNVILAIQPGLSSEFLWDLRGSETATAEAVHKTPKNAVHD
jgi:hypothetical protein